MTPPILIASDHGGFHLKNRIIRYLQNELSLKAEDLGPLTYNEEDDYPDYALPLAKKVALTGAYGILVCKNGIGMCIAANKVPGIRAGIGYSTSAAETMKTDDNTNVLCLASKGLTEEHALIIVKKWLETDFSQQERHVRRLKKIEDSLV